MPRKPRFYLPDIPAHIVQRGNDRQAVFFSDDDTAVYLGWLKQRAEKYGCAIHACVLMTNHVHLLLTPNAKDSISKTLQYVGRNNVTYIKHTYGRSGTLWEGRHKGAIISSDEYLLACMRYIEMNPVRASMVKVPGEYPWSSYLLNINGCASEKITPHRTYMRLGAEAGVRGHAYRELFRSALESSEVHAIRTSVQTETHLGNNRLREQVERALKLKVGHAKRARPRKKGADPFKLIVRYLI